MAFKPVLMSDCTSTVSAIDPAFDRAKSDFEAFGKERWKNPSCWKTHLKILDGQQPTVFVIGVVSSSDMNRIDDECPLRVEGESISHSSERFWRLFINGVRKLEQWQGEAPQMKTINGVEYVDPAWLAKTFVRDLRQVAIEIGMAVGAFNSLTQEEIKN